MLFFLGFLFDLLDDLNLFLNGRIGIVFDLYDLLKLLCGLVLCGDLGDRLDLCLELLGDLLCGRQLRELLRGSCDHRIVCVNSGNGGLICVITLGVAHFGHLYGFLVDRCGSGRLFGRCRFGLCGRLLLGNGCFLCNGLNDRFLDHDLLFGLAILLDHLIVIKLPREVCICRNYALVLLGKRGNVILGKLERGCRLFLTDVFLDQLAVNEIVDGIKGILLLVSYTLNVDGGESVLLAHTLNELKCPLQLAGRADLVLEGRIGILLLASNVLSTVYGSLKCCGIDCKINFKNTGLNVDLCKRHSSVVEAVCRPADAGFGSLVCEQRVLYVGIILLNIGTRLDQLCLKALAVMRHDVASRSLIEANDALVSGEAILGDVVFLIVKIVLASVLCNGILGLVLILVELVLLVGILGVKVGVCRGLCKRGNGFCVARYLCGALFLKLGIDQIGKLCQNLLCGGTVSGRLCGGFLDDLLVRFGNDLFHDLVGALSVCGRNCLCRANRGNDRLLCRGNDLAGKHNGLRYGCDRRLFLNGSNRLLDYGLNRLVRLKSGLIRKHLCDNGLFKELVRFGYDLLSRKHGFQIVGLFYGIRLVCLLCGKLDVFGLLLAHLRLLARGAKRGMGNKIVSLCANDHDNRYRDQGNRRTSDGQRRDQRVCHLRNRAKQDRRNGILIRAGILRRLLCLTRQTLAACARQLDEQHAKADQLDQKQACQHDDGGKQMLARYNGIPRCNKKLSMQVRPSVPCVCDASQRSVVFHLITKNRSAQYALANLFALFIAICGTSRHRWSHPLTIRPTDGEKEENRPNFGDKYKYI